MRRPVIFSLLMVAAAGLVFQIHALSAITVLPAKTAPPSSTIVTFDSDQNKQLFLNKNHLKDSDLKPVPKLSAYVAPVEPEKVQASDGAHTHPNYQYQVVTTPNDPLYSQQWWLPQIAADSGWNITTGGNNVTIAVIDTGFALNHEDLTSRWAENSGEEGLTHTGDRCWTGVSVDKKTNHCDDDADGYNDNWRGWDFVSSDNDPMVGTTNPNGQYAMHGTMTSGLAGAATNNGVGVAGANWGARIMPLQAMSDDGTGYTDDIASAVRYAADHGAKAISMSLGSSAPDYYMQSQIDYAISKGVSVIAAAGNDGCNCMLYPANFPEVIAVGASDQSDNRAYFSSYGTNLDVMAPGYGSIRTTTWSASNPTANYTISAAGTSIATPIVSGLVALLYSRLPSATPDDIARILAKGAHKVTGMSGADRTDLYGYGRIDVYGSLVAASLAPPQGQLLSKHSISLSSNGPTNSPDQNSTCQSLVEAMCDIRLTGPGGIIKTLGQRAVDGWGGANFYWNAQTLGLTPGQWKVEAVSTKDGQTTVLSADYLQVSS